MKTRLALLVLVLGVCGMLVAVWMAARGQRAKLADGTVITLESATFGRQHRFVLGGVSGRAYTALLQFLRPWHLALPALQQMNRTSANDAVTFWFRMRSPDGRRPASLWFEVVDGPVPGAAHPSAYSRMPLALGEEIVGVTFENFPRRRKTIVARLVGARAAGEWAAPIEFHVRNPYRGDPPVWQPSPALATVRDGEIEFTLQRLTTGVRVFGAANSEGGRSQHAAEPENAGTRALFRVVEQGRVTTNWLPVRIEAQDATGNLSHTTQSRAEPTGDQVGVVFQDALWAGESAWKLRVEFSRTAGFAPGELWTTTITNLAAAIAAGLTDSPFASQTNYDGLTVALLGLAAGGRPGTVGMFRVRITPAPRDFHLAVVDALDERGRPFAHDLVSSSSGGVFSPWAEYTFELRGVTDAKSLQLTLALSKSRYAEFVAKAEPAN